MPYCSAGDLSRLLQRKKASWKQKKLPGGVNEQEITDWLLQIANGLAYIHSILDQYHLRAL